MPPRLALRICDQEESKRKTNKSYHIIIGPKTAREPTIAAILRFVQIKWLWMVCTVHAVYTSVVLTTSQYTLEYYVFCVRAPLHRVDCSPLSVSATNKEVKKKNVATIVHGPSSDCNTHTHAHVKKRKKEVDPLSAACAHWTTGHCCCCCVHKKQFAIWDKYEKIYFYFGCERFSARSENFSSMWFSLRRL